MTAIEKFTRFYEQLNLKDLSGLSDVYDDKISFVDPIVSLQGLDSLTQYFVNLIEGTRWCEFSIKSVEAILPVNSEQHSQFIIEWDMRFSSKKLSAAKVIQVNGISKITCSMEKVMYHRDYYDVGQLVYEHIPLLGNLVRAIKGRLQ